MRWGLLTLMLVSIAGCASRPSGDFCDRARPIILDPLADERLTENEARQIVVHNEDGEAACGWKPPGA
jgi:hypothetical protein